VLRTSFCLHWGSLGDFIFFGGAQFLRRQLAFAPVGFFFLAVLRVCALNAFRLTLFLPYSLPPNPMNAPGVRISLGFTRNWSPLSTINGLSLLTFLTATFPFGPSFIKGHTLYVLIVSSGLTASPSPFFLIYGHFFNLCCCFFLPLTTLSKPPLTQNRPVFCLTFKVFPIKISPLPSFVLV